MRVRTPRKLTIEVTRDELFLLVMGLRTYARQNVLTAEGREAKDQMDQVMTAAIVELDAGHADESGGTP